MKSLTHIAHQAVSKNLLPGDIAVDLTAGNGNDTLALSNGVGEMGRVYSFDIQLSAIETTRSLLEKNLAFPNVQLILGSHGIWSQSISTECKRNIKVIMMNLGYLPRGNKAITTLPDTTMSAIDASLDWLKPGGLLSVIAYTGHPGGRLEADAVEKRFSRLDANFFSIQKVSDATVDVSPILYLVYGSTHL